MAEKEIALNNLQAKHIESILIQRQSIDRDYANAVAIIAAGEDFDVPEKAPFKYEQNPSRIVITLPDEAKEPD